MIFFIGSAAIPSNNPLGNATSSTSHTFSIGFAPS